MAKRVATGGILIALALIFSYVESLIPVFIGVPGIRLGLANLVILTGLYDLPLPDIWLISLIRIVVAGLLFGTLISLLYSLAGGVLSLLVMLLLKKTARFSVAGVSMAGAVSHNIGQILTAMILTGTPAILYYLPVLMVIGLVTGLLLGLLSGRILSLLTGKVF